MQRQRNPISYDLDEWSPAFYLAGPTPSGNVPILKPISKVSCTDA